MNAHRIVTRSRFGVLRTMLLFVTFSIEYWIVMGHKFLAEGLYLQNSKEMTQFIFCYVGYMSLEMLFVFRGNNRKVYLSYESALSLFIKSILINVVMGMFFGATDFYGSVYGLAKQLILLIFLNLLTVLAVLIIINNITKLCNLEPENILYLTEEDEVSEKRLEGYESVYLVDVSARQRNDWLKLCYEKDITVYTTAKLSDILIRTSGIAQDKDQPVFYCTRFGIGRATALVKRGIDVICAILALLVTWPVMIIVAIAIKREDGGPVIYHQTRCTKDLKEFEIYKFRSMVVGSEENTGACLSGTDDERVTKVGKVLRSWKLDELPQLLNVLRGDMSIVGPRPERPELIRENCKNVPEFVLRTKVKAGLTGYAQVRGKYETNKLDKLKWDLIYIENYSLLLDLKIIIMTAIMLVKRRK